MHRLILTWLRDITADTEHFEKLRQEGVRRIEQRIEELETALKRTKQQQESLTEQIDARIDELTKTTSTTIRGTIEASIVRLQGQTEELNQLCRYTEHEITTLQGLASDPNVYEEYKTAIHQALAKIDGNTAAPAEEKKAAVASVFSSLTLQQDHIKTALSGVNLKGPVSMVYGVAPPV